MADNAPEDVSGTSAEVTSEIEEDKPETAKLEEESTVCAEGAAGETKEITEPEASPASCVKETESVPKTGTKGKHHHGGTKGAKGSHKGAANAKGGMASGGACASSGSYKWETLKSMNSVRVYTTPVIHNDEIYIIGGCDAMGQPLDSCEHYLASKRKWVNLPNMPTKRAAPACGVVKDKIVVIGGVGESQKAVNAVEVYSVTEEKWIVKDSLLEPLLGLSLIVKDDLIYVMGGMSLDTNPRGTVLSYDVEKDIWKKYASEMNKPRYATFSFFIDDKIYTIGGRQGKMPVAAFDCFDFKTEKWEELPEIPHSETRPKRVFAMYTSVGKHIVCLGGLKDQQRREFSSDVEVFDTETKTWKYGANMQMARGDFAVGVIDDKVVVAGGLGNDGKPLKNAEVYDLEADRWTQVTEIPSAHCSCSHIMLKGRLHVFGGLASRGPGNKVEALSFKKS